MEQEVKMESIDRKKEPKASKPTRLNTLPLEILGNVATHLERPSYLSNLTSTCKELRGAIQPKLYENLSLDIPTNWTSVAFLEHLVSQKAEGLRYTKGVSVSSQKHRVEHQENHGRETDDGLGLVDDFSMNEEEDSFGQQPYQARVLNTLVRLIIDKVPRDQLQYFHWRHTTKLSATTMRLLSGYHGPSLNDLRVYNTKEGLVSQVLSPGKFNTLHFGDIALDSSSCWLTGLVAKNARSLKNLKLGRERQLATGKMRGDRALARDKVVEFTTEICEGLLKAGEGLENSYDQNSGGPISQTLLSVNSFHLIGFDFTHFSKKGNPGLLDLDTLNSLTLESCFSGDGTLHLLSLTGSGSDTSWKPRLKTFVLRQESVTDTFNANLHTFFEAFSGLVHLSVLLEGPGQYLYPSCLIENHGTTLQTLVWEQRTGRQLVAGESTHTKGPASDKLAALISRRCPNLRELGLVMEPHLDGTRQTYTGLEEIAQLKHLRTLNIRNLPTLKKTDTKQVSTVQRCENLALNVTRDILNGYRGNQTPLHTIALGAVVCSDMWRARGKWGTDYFVEFWLCLRIYHVEHHVNIRGRRQPVLTLIAQGTAKEAEEHTSDLRICEPYWRD